MDLILLDTFSQAGIGSYGINLIATALALLLAGYFLEGITVKGIFSALIIAFALSILHATLGAFLDTLAIGFNLVSFGLFSFVVDAVVILVASWFLDGFRVKSFLWAIVLAFVLSILNGVILRMLT